jgi:hypothetical protein
MVRRAPMGKMKRNRGAPMKPSPRGRDLSENKISRYPAKSRITASAISHIREFSVGMRTAVHADEITRGRPIRTHGLGAGVTSESLPLRPLSWRKSRSQTYCQPCLTANAESAICVAQRYSLICSISRADATHSTGWHRLRKIRRSLSRAPLIIAVGRLLNDSLLHLGHVIGKTTLSIFF